jgi:uroporphyrinogen III methyltransferase/synthase
VETGGREVLVKQLSDRGAKIVEVAAYQSSCPKEIEPQAWLALQQRQVDIITFASSKTVRNFARLIEQALKTDTKETIQSLLANVTLASIGPQTSQTCQELFGRVDVEAKEYTLEGLTEALIQIRS